MSVLVLGANGTLGQTFRQHHRCGNNVDFAVHHMDSSDIWFDITNVDDEYAIEILRSYDYVVNCAAVTNVDDIESVLDVKNEAYTVNAFAVKNLARWCLLSNTTLIHISTDFVFDGKTYRPYIEDDKTNPINTYGKTKELGEVFIRESGCRYFIIRTSWLYSEYGNNMFTKICKYFADGKELKGADDIISSPTYARDLVLFICKLINDVNSEYLYGIYHFTDEGVCTKYDFMCKVGEELDSKLCGVKPVRNTLFNCPAMRPYCSVLSKDKARKVISIPHWEDSLLHCIANYRTLIQSNSTDN